MRNKTVSDGKFDLISNSVVGGAFNNDFSQHRRPHIKLASQEWTNEDKKLSR